MCILLAGQSVGICYDGIDSRTDGPAFIVALENRPSKGWLRFSPSVTKLLAPESFVAVMGACETES